jgi:DNA transformation protein
MKPPQEFATRATDLLSSVRSVVARRTLDGHGLYCDGTMFALIADGVLYPKVDDENRSDFERGDTTPVAYGARGRRVVMSYLRAPEEVLGSRTRTPLVCRK